MALLNLWVNITHSFYDYVVDSFWPNAQKTQVIQLNFLNDDCLLHLLELFQMDSLIELLLVNRRWNWLIKERILTKVKWIQVDNLCNSSVGQSIKHYSSDLLMIRFDGFQEGIRANHRTVNRFLTAALFPNVTEFTFTPFGEEIQYLLCQYLIQWPSLTKLKVVLTESDNKPFASLHQLIWQLIDSLRSLSCLDLSSYLVNHNGEPLLGHSKDQSWEIHPRRMPVLSYLLLSQLESFSLTSYNSSDALAKLSHNCQLNVCKLKKLSLDNAFTCNSNVNQIGHMLVSIGSVNNITHLVLTGLPYLLFVDAYDISHFYCSIGNNFPSLQSLHIEICSSSQPYLLSFLTSLSKCPQLISLTLEPLDWPQFECVHHRTDQQRLPKLTSIKQVKLHFKSFIVDHVAYIRFVQGFFDLFFATFFPSTAIIFPLIEQIDIHIRDIEYFTGKLYDELSANDIWHSCVFIRQNFATQFGLKAKKHFPLLRGWTLNGLACFDDLD